MRSLFSRLCRSSIPRLAAVLPVALAWSNLAVCGEIHDAAANGDVAQARALLKNNPNLVSSVDNTSWLPLHWAAYKGHKDIVELLLANKADINAKDKNRMTALSLAAGKGHVDVAKLLLEDKAEYTIHDVAALGDLERTRALLKDHPELANSIDGDDHTPLDLAANKDVAELLLANKADLNRRRPHSHKDRPRHY